MRIRRLKVEAYSAPALLDLLEVPPQRVAALVRGRVVHDGRRLARHRAVLLLALRARVLVVLPHRVVLLPLLTPVYVVL